MKNSTFIGILLAGIAAVTGIIVFIAKKTSKAATTTIASAYTASSNSNVTNATSKKIEFTLLNSICNSVVTFVITNVDYTMKTITWGTYVMDFLKTYGKDSGAITTTLGQINNAPLNITQDVLTVKVSYLANEDKVKFDLLGSGFGNLSSIIVNFKTKQIEEVGTNTNLLKQANATGNDIL